MYKTVLTSVKVAHSHDPSPMKHRGVMLDDPDIKFNKVRVIVVLLTETLKGDKLGFSTIPPFSEAGTLERLRLLGNLPGDTSVEEKSGTTLSSDL